MTSNEREREYNRIAANRISRLDGGLPVHVAIAMRPSITLRNKLKRMGLEGEHITDLIQMIDEIGMQETLQHMPLGVRFATVKQAQRPPSIWRPNKPQNTKKN
jgi:hypothetical protein